MHYVILNKAKPVVQFIDKGVPYWVFLNLIFKKKNHVIYTCVPIQH